MEEENGGRGERAQRCEVWAGTEQCGGCLLGLAPEVVTPGMRNVSSLIGSDPALAPGMRNVSSLIGSDPALAWRAAELV